MQRLFIFLCLTGLFFLFSSINSTALAESRDSSTIRIQVMHSGVTKIKGPAIAGTEKEIKLSDLKNKKSIKLGTLGMRSRHKANCDISFKSANNFKLQHNSVSNAYLANYQIAYDGNVLDQKTSVHSGCNFSAKEITLKPSNIITKEKKTGYYSDTVTVVITVP